VPQWVHFFSDIPVLSMLTYSEEGNQISKISLPCVTYMTSYWGLFSLGILFCQKCGTGPKQLLVFGTILNYLAAIRGYN